MSVFNETRVQQAIDLINEERRLVGDNNVRWNEFVNSLHDPTADLGDIHIDVRSYTNEELHESLRAGDVDEVIRRLRIQYPPPPEPEDEDEDEPVCDRCEEEVPQTWRVRGRELCEECADAVGRRHLRRREDRRILSAEFSEYLMAQVRAAEEMAPAHRVTPLEFGEFLMAQVRAAEAAAPVSFSVAAGSSSSE